MPSKRTRLILKSAVLTLAAAGALAGLAGVAVLFGGWYDISATKSHFPLVYTVLEKGMEYSVKHHAEGIQVPPLGAPAQLRRGAALYRDKCAQCHGGPGVAAADYGKSMQPVPGPLMDATLNWRTRELYWITRHGIKMSGMPAWGFHMSEEDMWATVAFVKALPHMTPQAYREATMQEKTP